MSTPPADIGAAGAMVPAPGSSRPSPAPQDPVNLKLDLLVHSLTEAREESFRHWRSARRLILFATLVSIVVPAILVGMLR
ncbi:hypothetical protein ABIF21_007112 [Bradyrhizobium elkanii]|uniref:hypothetical protein n=1 Tax=Bradyrhizobium elkanii TaxID=29448 RepID=UPI0016767368|nr:hypothetical protein [Bradyrhizobium elkanii]MCW2112500.1 hypothetical protein [Bradyrhizobium elkanii]MCW2199143.1 hypothetical protein [Bradyrhizobium elkanii]MCW2229304.1 hypothetical protein [Bradyrhizobium elkanii]